MNISLATITSVFAAGMVVTLLAVMPMSAHSATTPSADVTIAQLEDAYLKSIKSADTVFLEKNVDSAYRGTNIKGELHDKAGLIAKRKDGGLKYSEVELLDRNIRMLGATAVVWERVRLVSEVDGKSSEKIVQITRVWQEEKKGWKIVAFQATEVVESATTK